ncbi:MULTISPECIES: hypothetical protein [Enterobacteriaceae]|uniref:hypothetical protein n=1 Tax=Enterobacteriaceae TaxID=543 RepID=UPI000272A029|nr:MULTISPECIES: hypothetical protein [unclassified Enterobacter]EJF31066.1 hypothetical protein A936_10710 [Enterobacter sp. Ag1]NIF49920.1 hypothetical protein [Enterobacter sp. Ap-1006]
MFYRNDVISYLQSNKILAQKLDRAVIGVRKAVSHQIETIGAGATRALYYTSCFTEEYQDVCQQQKTEDIRFTKGVIYLLKNGGVIGDMLEIYFVNLIKFRTSEQLQYIQKKLMAVNARIASNTLTSHGLALMVASTVAFGMGARQGVSIFAGHTANRVAMGATMYGVVQRAAESAHRLRAAYPGYYSALYAQDLEMMYFLIEPLFQYSRARDVVWTSDDEIIDIITSMVR